MKLYFCDHQAARVVSAFPFLKPPTDEQIAAVRAILDKLHGATHPKDGKQLWIRVVEIEVIEDQLPSIPEPERGPNELPAATISVVAHIENP